ncbi:uncharacterized protein LOC130948285 [Arachis stenosperma]|uniref:uncharacterized protein LOC130948285 n=1 Tax=Arachis stenosperma TaxID=217475 RepID=UPI0025AD97A2|nr:uncharacterized protein LOC130948285 [Arachis stenosperma]
MEDIPKLDSSSSSFSSVLESEEKKMESGAQRISVSDHINAYQYTAEKVDSFVIDMDSFSSPINKDSSNINPRITLQRSLSRKGSQRGGDRKVNGNVSLHERDTVPTTSSPKAAMAGCNTLEKSTAVGSTHQSTNPNPPQSHHQITITASNMCSTPPSESKLATRRNSFRRHSSWLLDPKRVLLIFATLSSMGTLLLIFFTLAISKQNPDEYVADLQQ